MGNFTSAIFQHTYLIAKKSLKPFGSVYVTFALVRYNAQVLLLLH
jgi:hypothetical protein